MSAKSNTLRLFKTWYAGLPVVKQHGGPARGTLATALIVLEHLKADYDLALASHQSTRGRAQIAGASGAAVAKVLASFGETRVFLAEGGRTNRGGPGAIHGMLRSLGKARLDTLPRGERNAILAELQRFLVSKVTAFHNRQRLKFSYDPGRSTWQCIHELLSIARQTGKEGPVGQYLVGAKLQLRFPQETIRNESYSAADRQTGKHGDFSVQDTIFHVTVAPMSLLFDKCARTGFINA